MKGYNLASQNHELTEFAHIITLPAHHGLPQAVSLCHAHATSICFIGHLLLVNY